MFEYVIARWDAVRIIHAPGYMRELPHSPPLHSPRLFLRHRCSLLVLVLRRSLSPTWAHIRFLLSRQHMHPRRHPNSHPLVLRSFGSHRGGLYFMHHHGHAHTDSPILAATYIVDRNAESYSVNLDSLKQVLMSCLPTTALAPPQFPQSNLCQSLLPASLAAEFPSGNTAT